jgi:putative ABC transport system permease protein
MTLGRNLAFAARQLRKSPAFTITVVTTLALCIGANAAIYSIVDALFFRPLPYPDPDRLLMLGTISRHGNASAFDNGQDGREWETVRDHATFLDSVVYGGTNGVNLVANRRVEYVQEQRVSANFFRVLGVDPILGREFTRQEDVRGGPALAILSYEIWQRLFRGDPSIVGRTIDLRGAPYTVLGIMPGGFRTDSPADLWTPLQPSTQGEGSGTNYAVIARMKPNVTLADVNGQLAAIMRPIFRQVHLLPGMTLEERAMPLQAGRATDVRSNVDLMWAAVILVLIIGCVNIAGILLARSGARSREVATRIALGAGRTAIVGQLLTESLLLALGGGIFGIVLGYFGLNALKRLSTVPIGFAGDTPSFEIFHPLQLDFRVVAVIIAIALGTSILFGLAPALEATSLDIRSSLAEGGRGATAGHRKWMRNSLVIAEVALGVVLVIASGLLIRTFSSLMNLNPGFNPDHVLTASLSLEDARYNTTASGLRLFNSTLDRIRQIPGIESATVALTTPYERPLNYGVSVRSSKGTVQDITNLTWVTPGFFETLQIPLLRGRVLSDADNVNAAKVVVVNRAFVHHFLKGVEPMGAHVDMDGKPYQIVGVVGDIQQKNGWGKGYAPIAGFAQVYMPLAQVSDGLFSGVNIWFTPSFIVRSHVALTGLPDAMRRALEAVDPRLPFSSFHTMPEIRGAAISQQRYQAVLFSSLATLAILLAALGVYGLIAQSVAERTREMGIRLALGATARGIVRAAAMPGIKLCLAGIAGGLILASYATRLMKSLIWGVSTTDPWTFGAVAALLLAVAAISSILPALRLSRLDPARTLRQE